MKDIGVHILKVDRDYIANLISQEENRHMVSAFIQIARSLGIKALAVGVEDQETGDLCASLGFDMAQGYFYSKPLDDARLIEFLS
jgi:EAL domain-containing protein (putative c-di-GMP-specific phosphodiesterase class I)